ncbi:polysaccharide deacetylase family protein [Bacilliculturomica massiliensis]|uniref:polysaccharide deacetylase family protein n=1 Tax=Bacilliculturomica massiliensis TaxID=1917867 RepID=UPI0010310091|nr:polysaccharide deacetylase family protein [Bacilliculturomica massiliensis]
MKKTTWSGHAKCAFSFGWDLDGETIWRNKSKNFPGGETFIRSRSVGAFGPMRGAYRILDIMDKYHLKSTWFIPAENVARYPQLVREIQAAGHEIANHGLDHSPFYGSTPEAQLDNIRRSQDIFLQVLGKKAVGFRPTGPLLPETEDALFSDSSTLYYSRGLAEEEICFCTASDGKQTGVVSLPCRQELDEYIQMVYCSYPPIPTGQDRIAPYADVLAGFLRELQGGARFGSAMSTAFHPQVSGTPGKSLIIEKLCEYIASTPDIWCATCEEVAALWKKSMEE